MQFLMLFLMLLLLTTFSTIPNSNVPFCADDEGETALYQAAAAGSTECVQLLILAGASAIQGNEEAITPLIIASYNGFASICRLLVTLGHVDVNQKDNTQKSALLLASYAGHVEIMAELIEHGAALDALDQYGWSSLMLAAYAGKLEACKLLLEHGADPHIKTSNGKNARSLSWDAGHKSIAVYISKFVAKGSMSLNLSSSRPKIQPLLSAPKSPSRRTHSPAPSLPSVPEEYQEDDNHRTRYSFSGHTSTISRHSAISSRFASPPTTLRRAPATTAPPSSSPPEPKQESLLPSVSQTATVTNLATMFDAPTPEPAPLESTAEGGPSHSIEICPTILATDFYARFGSENTGADAGRFVSIRGAVYDLNQLFAQGLHPPMPANISPRDLSKSLASRTSITFAEKALMDWIRSMVGRDATMALQKRSDRRDLEKCMVAYFKVGEIFGQTNSCVASIVVDSLALALWLLVALMRLGSALVYRWVLVRANGLSGKESSEEMPKHDAPVLMLIRCRETNSEQDIKATLDSLAISSLGSHGLFIVVVESNVGGQSLNNASQICQRLMETATDPMHDKESKKPDLHRLSFEVPSVDPRDLGRVIANQHQMFSGHYTVHSKRVPFILLVRSIPGGRSSVDPSFRDTKRLILQFLHRSFYDLPMSLFEFSLYEQIRQLTGQRPERYESLLMTEMGTVIDRGSLEQMCQTLKNNDRVMAVCGQRLIQNRTESWLTRIQDYGNFLENQFVKSFESTLGTVQGLPDELCMIRIKMRPSITGQDTMTRDHNRHSGDTSNMTDTDGEDDGLGIGPTNGVQDDGEKDGTMLAPAKRGREMDGYHYSVPILVHPAVASVYCANQKTLHQRRMVSHSREDRYLTGLLHAAFPTRRIVYLPQATYRTRATKDLGTYFGLQRAEWSSRVHSLGEQIVSTNQAPGTGIFRSWLHAFSLLKLLLMPVMILSQWILIILVSVGAARGSSSTTLLDSPPAIIALAFVTLVMVYKLVLGVFLMRSGTASLSGFGLMVLTLPLWYLVVPFSALWSSEGILSETSEQDYVPPQSAEMEATMALKEENFVMLHSGSWNTTAGMGVFDTNKPPSVTIRSLVGSRTVAVEPTEDQGDDAQKTDSDTAIAIDTPQAPESEASETTKDDVEIKTEEEKEGSEKEAEEKEEEEGEKKADEPQQEGDKTQTVYYCGGALTEAQQQYPESELTIASPIEQGIVKDWSAMEALWRHVLFRELGIKRSRNASPVLMVVPTDWTKEEHERITQIFFENFNVPGLYLAEEPLMILYGCATVTGLIIDIGHNSTEITPIIDTQIQRNAIQTIPLAGADIDAYFLQQLRQDAQLVREYGEPMDLEFARHLKESGVCQALAKDEKGANARTHAEYNGKRFTVGSVRYKAVDPLFNPDLVGKRVLNIIDAIHAALYGVKPEKRQALWESIIVTGGSCQIAGLQNRIQSAIEDSLTVSENFGEFQVREVKFLKIPDYFPSLKDSIVHAGFLGSEIVAKLIFPDPRNYINKVDYNESGPSVVHTKTF
ncbi:general RNA polymerase II transcription factor [Podila clonocystis]|nr:general RNA polymerase II transcription factor [Podila clonocystis]